MQKPQPNNDRQRMLKIKPAGYYCIHTWKREVFALLRSFITIPPAFWNSALRVARTSNFSYDADKPGTSEVNDNQLFLNEPPPHSIRWVYNTILRANLTGPFRCLGHHQVTLASIMSWLFNSFCGFLHLCCGPCSWGVSFYSFCVLR